MFRDRLFSFERTTYGGEALARKNWVRRSIEALTTETRDFRVPPYDDVNIGLDNSPADAACGAFEAACPAASLTAERISPDAPMCRGSACTSCPSRRDRARCGTHLA